MNAYPESQGLDLILLLYYDIMILAMARLWLCYCSLIKGYVVESLDFWVIPKEQSTRIAGFRELPQKKAAALGPKPNPNSDSRPNVLKLRKASAPKP